MKKTKLLQNFSFKVFNNKLLVHTRNYCLLTKVYKYCTELGFFKMYNSEKMMCSNCVYQSNRNWHFCEAAIKHRFTSVSLFPSIQLCMDNCTAVTQCFYNCIPHTHVLTTAYHTHMFWQLHTTHTCFDNCIPHTHVLTTAYHTHMFWQLHTTHTCFDNCIPHTCFDNCIPHTHVLTTAYHTHMFWQLHTTHTCFDNCIPPPTHTQLHSDLPLTPSLPQPVNSPGWKLRTSTNSIPYGPTL